MTIAEFNAKLNIIFPPETAWSGDKIGLQIDRIPNDEQLSKVLIAYELNQEVLREAIENTVECICVFHPLIFKPLETISSTDRIGSLVHTLIRHNIGLIVIHTNFDTHPMGTNALAAKALGLMQNSIQPLIPDINHDNFGMGIVGNLVPAMSALDFAARCSEVFGSPIRYCIGNTDEIQKVAIVCGSGFSYLQEAIDSKANCFITADVKYHGFHEANNTIMLIDPGHAEMERFVTQGIFSIVKDIQDFSGMKFIQSQISTSPVKYFQSK